MGWQDDIYNDVMARRADKAKEWMNCKPKKLKKAIRQSGKGPNATEARFELEYLLPWQHLGEIVGYQFEAITLRLGNGVRYKPDYLTYGPKGTRIYEVKGEWIEEDAKVKLKIAPRQFHFWEFYLAQWIKGVWTINKVLP